MQFLKNSYVNLSYLIILISILFLICMNEVIAAKCKTDSDCQATNSFNVCVNKVCAHKPTFPVLPIFVFIVFKGISSIGGVGGGAIAIPLSMNFFGLPLKQDTAVSGFAIGLSTFTKFLTSFNEKNSEKPFVVSIDYGITNIMMPLTLLGSFIGAYVYVAFPDFLLQILLTIVLFFLTIKSFIKGI